MTVWIIPIHGINMDENKVAIRPDFLLRGFDLGLCRHGLRCRLCLGLCLGIRLRLRLSIRLGLCRSGSRLLRLILQAVHSREDRHPVTGAPAVRHPAVVDDLHRVERHAAVLSEQGLPDVLPAGRRDRHGLAIVHPRQDALRHAFGLDGARQDGQCRRADEEIPDGLHYFCPVSVTKVPMIRGRRTVPARKLASSVP